MASTLASRAAATVVEIKYRLNPQHRYPTPVHDVLFGYDWVLQHLVPSRAIVRPGRSSSHVVRIGVMGELVGGSLASMLALTECRPSGPHVAAAAVNEPIVDWVFPESATGSTDSSPAGKTARSRKKQPSFSAQANGSITTSALLQGRRTLFKKPEHYFDPFASPVLFFRSPGAEVPQESFEEPLDDFSELARMEQQDFHRQQLRLSALSNMAVQQAAGVTTEEASRVAPRKASRRFPRPGSGLKIPEFHISTAASSALYDQAVEFASMLRRSRMREDEADRDEDDAPADKQKLAKDFALHVRDRAELWSTGEKDVSEAAEWFKNTLD